MHGTKTSKECDGNDDSLDGKEAGVDMKNSLVAKSQEPRTQRTALAHQRRKAILDALRH